MTPRHLQKLREPQTPRERAIVADALEHAAREVDSMPDRICRRQLAMRLRSESARVAGGERE